ncbi:hypothetical protein ABIE44_001918 [Marmoricola sp. OAE513]|uniref:oxygenase MpaB family protein n=1 Tax=Marmoricola sp. OAE513 TaxID=2817894 RepID=UPI001AE2C80E
MLNRYANRDRIAAMDPATHAREIYTVTAYREFPWDVPQALGLALFRTYAVPSIGEVLYGTGEFTEKTQKRYDDTVMLIDAAIEHGMEHPRGRAAVRRMNQMHRAYDISNDDMLYVLCTFVVEPIRWIDRWGWRATTAAEREASAAVYRNLGGHMGISDMPTTYDEFAAFQDAYEAEHFRWSRGGHHVAVATLELLTTFRPFSFFPTPVVKRLAYGLLDDPLLRALGLPRPTRVERLITRAIFRGRARIERFLPPRRKDKLARDLTSVRTYPKSVRGTFPLDEVGTFPGCPVNHDVSATG